MRRLRDYRESVVVSEISYRQLIVAFPIGCHRAIVRLCFELLQGLVHWAIAAASSGAPNSPNVATIALAQSATQCFVSLIQATRVEWVGLPGR